MKIVMLLRELREWLRENLEELAFVYIGVLGLKL